MVRSSVLIRRFSPRWRARQNRRRGLELAGEDKPIEAEPLRPGKAARAVVSDGRAVRDAIEAVLAAPGEAREVARQAHEAVRDALLADALDAMPVDSLRGHIQKKVTFGALIDAGLTTVGQVLAAGAAEIGRIPGVRRRSARRIVSAAAQLRETVKEAIRVRIDPDARTPEQTALIAALRRYERARSALKGPDLSPLASGIGQPPRPGGPRREPGENALHVLRAEEGRSPRCPHRTG